MSSSDNHKVTFGLFLEDNKRDTAPEGLKAGPEEEQRQRPAPRNPKLSLTLSFICNYILQLRVQSNFLVNIVYLNV